MYWGSSAFLNLGFVVLSKQRMRWSISSANTESSRKPERSDLAYSLNVMILGKDGLSRKTFAWMLTKTDPWK